MAHPHILLIGHLSAGFHALGPFPSYDAAHTYGELNCAEGFFLVMRLYDPEEKNDVT